MYAEHLHWRWPVDQVTLRHVQIYHGGNAVKHTSYMQWLHSHFLYASLCLESWAKQQYTS